ncbi:CBO0543 family protein [Paenibacillus sp. GCM10027628]|uniref:CBO0543 family protein n=1 Tax=Paenibacillus sp. GCM10027628 TaxID=3273413 RepID=UPI0036432E39
MTIEEGIQRVDEASQKMVEANTLINDAIMNSFLFTWRWWLGIALFILPWIVWIIYRKRESTARFFLAGLSSIILGILIDKFAIALGIWSYPIKFIPNSGFTLLPFQYSMLPVGVMFALQWKPNMNPFLKGILMGGFSAYIVEPIFTQMRFYNPKNWLYTYDVFIYFTIFMVAYWISNMSAWGPIRSDNKADRSLELTLHSLGRKQKAK